MAGITQLMLRDLATETRSHREKNKGIFHLPRTQVRGQRLCDSAAKLRKVSYARQTEIYSTLNRLTMEKEFWNQLAENEYKIPDGNTLHDLTKTIFGYLGNVDPDLRDEIAYIVYANWLKRDMYSPDEIRLHIAELLANLEKGIGETESDTVFLRAFSALFLAEIVHNDNKKSVLEPADISSIFDKGLQYLDAEKDPRGFMPVKGWAHALAHTADLMMVLGKNRHMEKIGLEKVLQGIADKLIHSTSWVYIHGEDERLANAMMTILQRNLITDDFLRKWLKSITQPEKSWNGAYMDEGHAKAFHNTRNFLRSLAEGIRSTEELPNKAEITSAIYEAIDDLKPY